LLYKLSLQNLNMFPSLIILYFSAYKSSQFIYFSEPRRGLFTSSFKNKLLFIFKSLMNFINNHLKYTILLTFLSLRIIALSDQPWIKMESVQKWKLPNKLCLIHRIIALSLIYPYTSSFYTSTKIQYKSTQIISILCISKTISLALTTLLFLR